VERNLFPPANWRNLICILRQRSGVLRQPVRQWLHMTARLKEGEPNGLVLPIPAYE